MPRPLRTRVGAALAMTLLLLAACGGGSTGSGSSGDEAAQEPQRGGTLTMNLWLEAPRGLDPTQFQSLTAPANDGHRAFAIYDLLLAVDPETSEVQPRIAESFTSDDARTWTFTLRSGVKFSDGTAYDAEAVRFNWERHRDPANMSAAQSVVDEIESMEVVDPLTLRVTLRHPNGQFPRVVATRLSAIGSPTAIEDDPEAFAEHPVGAGPFVVTEWVRDSHLTLERNPDYWDAPRPYADQLVFRILPDYDQSYNSLQAGEAQLMYTSAAPVAHQAEQAGYESSLFVPDGGRLMLMNATREPFDDPRLREAMTQAFDLDQMNETVEQGLNEVPETIFAEDTTFYDPSLTLPTYDHDEAQALIDEVAEDNGGPIEFTLIYSASTAQQAEFLQSQMATYDNIEMAIEPVEVDFTGEVVRRSYDAAIYAHQMQDPEPETWDYMRADSPRYLGGATSPELEDGIVIGHETLDEAERQDAYRQVQQALIDESYGVWYSRFQLYNIVDTDAVGGYSTINDHLPRFDQMWVR